MSEKNNFITERDFPLWVEDLSREREIFFPRPLNGDWKYVAWRDGSGKDIRPSPYRAIESLKGFLFSERVPVARFPGRLEGDPARRPRALIGLKACDLACLPVLDYIFREGDYADPFYAALREETLLISQDCTGFKEVCFCPLVGGRPYPSGGFDLNLSPVTGGYVVEAGSEKGEGVLDSFRRFFQPASKEQTEERAKVREEVFNKLKHQLQEQGQLERAPSAERVRAKAADPLWTEESVPCVECGACNLVCPTCHCFILEELRSGSGSTRLRNWDSCQYPGFSREAGGANPRALRSERLSNRFSKKFQFFPDLIDVVACTGCGRCIEACMGKIDIRKVLKRIERGKG